MGYSTQGKNAHESLVARQDSEIRLLELMRRCLLQKVKCDREYASAIASVAQQGLKIDKTDEPNGSQVLQAWKKFMEEMENQSKLIRTNTENLENVCTDRMSQMCQEKRKLKKQYQEEHAKIASRFYQLTEDVARKKAEYQKHLEYYKQMRMRFEEHYIKSGRAGRKLDDVRDKYQKACRKLHLAHNEYVLLLHEATEVEKDYRTILLPTLLAHQQTDQEQFITNWKNLLNDIAKFSDYTSNEYLSIQQHISNSINSITPTDEYKDLADKYKSLPVIFRFDDNPNEENFGKLQPNQLAIDNLTIESLRQRIADLEQSIKECQEKQQKIAGEINGKKISSSTSSIQSAASNNILTTNSSNLNGVSNSMKDTKFNKDLCSLKCQERQMNKLVEIIRSSLNEVSINELPSGCDDISVEIDKNLGTDENILTVSNRPIYEEEWFHGVLPREEVVRLLRNDGDFLVRETTRNDESQTVLSVCWNGHKHFIVQTTADGHFRFEGPSFPSIQELILHQFQSELPVTSRSGAILKTPIFKEHWELSNDDVILIDKIGRGNFGDVYKAKLKSSRQDVAVKTCKHSLPDEQKRKFLQEGRILKQYDHPNIVKLIGICVQKQPIMIVMELVEGGSLLTYLRKNSATLDQQQMMGICRDTAAGMRYLESKNCIHRDLAARNCLIGSENIVKISDFGMSREEEEYIVSDGMKQIPIKWTAPEALNFGKYNSLCDVWSYGILIWEIFSKGGTPYPGLSNSKAREKIDEGYRMPMPEGTQPEMYKLMLKCWKEIPEERPHFDEIFTVVDCLMKKQ
ncbi:unnamed protein product [Chironomus riparius]|uniref:Tyrosine-protein kinase n=1 Tax=Chironomus riparius TaxID=315576 RepID=A0A9P0J6F9_9DIPT|nr:unnamed protein product [Chironomus riparius]